MSSIVRSAADLAVLAAGRVEALIELLQQVGQFEVRRGLERIVVAHGRERHADDAPELAARAVVDLRDVLRELLAVQERGDRHGFLGLLVDHDREADAAVRMAAAVQLAPIRLRPVRQIGPIGEGAHERDREPVADRFAQSDLILHVVRQVRQRVALRLAALVGDFFVAAGERNRLEAEERDDLRIVEREADHRSNLLVVDAVDDRDDRDDLDTRVVQVVDRLAASRRTDCRPDGANWLRFRYHRTADTHSAGRLRRPACRTRGSWRTRCRWSRPEHCCSRP